MQSFRGGEHKTLLQCCWTLEKAQQPDAPPKVLVGLQVWPLTQPPLPTAYSSQEPQMAGLYRQTPVPAGPAAGRSPHDVPARPAGWGRNGSILFGCAQWLDAAGTWKLPGPVDDSDCLCVLVAGLCRQCILCYLA